MLVLLMVMIQFVNAFFDLHDEISRCRLLITLIVLGVIHGDPQWGVVFLPGA
jgi:hypothetical protein